MNDQNTNKKEQNGFTNKLALTIALEFGFIIAIPLLVFSLIGKWLANHYHNRLFLIFALVLALIVSSSWLYIKINDIYERLTKK